MARIEIKAARIMGENTYPAAVPPRDRVAVESMPVFGTHAFTAAGVENGLHRLTINNVLPYQYGMVIQMIGATEANWALFWTAMENPPHTRLGQANKRLVGGNAAAASELEADDNEIWVPVTAGKTGTTWNLHSGLGALGAHYLLAGNTAENPTVAMFAK